MIELFFTAPAVKLCEAFWQAVTARGKRRARSFPVLFRCVAAVRPAKRSAQALAEFRRLHGALQQEDAAVGAVSTIGKAAVPDPAAHHKVARLVRAKGYGLFLLTLDDLPRALQIAGEQFPTAIGAFLAYGHGRVLLSVTGCASKFSIAYISGTWQAFCAAFHAQTADFPSCFRMKLCLTGVTVGVRMIPLQRQ